MDITTLAQEILTELMDQLAHADRLIEEQAHRIEALKAEIARLSRAAGVASELSSPQRRAATCPPSP